MKNYVFISLVSLNVLMYSCEPKASPVAVQTPEPEQAEETPPANDPSRLLPSFLPTIAYPVFITGETTYSSKLKPEAWFSQPAPKPDLGSIAAPGKVPLMVAFGGGLTAGVSNGGLNREAQQFAYPNLVAHQMGIADFVTPLLSENEANGTGIFLYEDPKAEYPRWKEVKNNLAKLESGMPVKMTPYEGVIHNFAYPGGGTIGIGDALCNECPRQPYLSRMDKYHNNKDSTVLDKIKRSHDYNFVIMEDFIDGLNSIMVSAPLIDIRWFSSDWFENTIPSYGMKKIVDKGQKGVIFTIPHLKDWGYFNWYNTAELKKKANPLQLSYTKDYHGAVADVTQELYLKPTPVVEDLFRRVEKGKPLNGNLEDLDLIDDVEFQWVNPDRVYNPNIRKFALERNLALVDLRDIYERIHSGTYKTDDGLSIDSSPSGNFFSSDGMYPTPIGQAVIANEVIKAINTKYGAHIPLINVTQFATIIGLK